MKNLRWQIAVGLLLLAAWCCYSPGLAGGFLFDDFVALPVLGATGPVDDWATFLRYITSGTSDPTGRPIALLSFLLDATDWPADAAPFLRTNILLHLLNGLLLYRLLCALSAWLEAAPAKNRSIALLASGLWLLHPLLVSTVLYVVQREAMLATSFVLAGLLAYVHGRTLFARAPRRGIAFMAAGIVGGTILATLCKANGVLLPLLATTLETTVLRAGEVRPEARPRLRTAHLLLLGLPTLVLAVYVALLIPDLVATNDRPWTIGQRLLTQPRALVDYLQQLVVPRVLTAGVFNDAYPVSTGLNSPPETWMAMLAVAVLGATGWMLRRRAPALAGAILFFLAGHALESTVLPLELYFEHRNYLPAVLLFWPAARVVAGWRPAPRYATGLLLLACCAFLTWQRSTLWSQPRQMAAVWALQHPDSSRAQANAAQEDIAAGQPERALARLEPLWARHPADLQLAINYAQAACTVRGLSTDEIRRLADALRTAREGGTLVYGWLHGLVAGAACPGVDPAVLSAWIDAARANPTFSRIGGRRQDIASLAAQLALRQGNARRALDAFDRALDASPTPQAAAGQAALLGMHGHPELGLRHLDHYERLRARQPARASLNMAWLHARVLTAQGYWPHELANLRAQLREDARRAGGGGATP